MGGFKLAILSLSGPNSVPTAQSIKAEIFLKGFHPALKNN